MPLTECLRRQQRIQDLLAPPQAPPSAFGRQGAGQKPVQPPNDKRNHV